MVERDHQPRATCQKERAHLLDEAVDEVLFEAADLALRFGLDAVQDGAGEDRVEFHEVLLAKDSLCLLAHAEEAAGLEEVVFALHVVDEGVELGLADAAEVGDAVEELPAAFDA